MTDLELMQKIKNVAGDMITDICARSSVPAAFIAALIANETGGQEYAKRFEPGVLGQIWQVLMGREAAFGSIGRQDLLLWIVSGKVPAVGQHAGNVPAADSIPANALNRLDDLANSWGVTQIMGYHALEPATLLTKPDDLQDYEKCVRESLRLLAEFAHRYQFDLASEFDPMFRCWNTGKPNGKTFDPEYVPNGLRRMQLYIGLTVANGSAH